MCICVCMRECVLVCVYVCMCLLVCMCMIDEMWQNGCFYDGQTNFKYARVFFLWVFGAYMTSNAEFGCAIFRIVNCVNFFFTQYSLVVFIFHFYLCSCFTPFPKKINQIKSNPHISPLFFLVNPCVFFFVFCFLLFFFISLLPFLFKRILATFA